MALVDDDVPVVLHELAGLTLPRERLHHRDVDLAGGLGFAAPDGADHALADAQEGLQPRLPLLEQFGAMYQHQCVHAASGDQRRGRDGLAERGRRAQDSRVVAEHCGNRRLLV